MAPGRIVFKYDHAGFVRRRDHRHCALDQPLPRALFTQNVGQNVRAVDTYKCGFFLGDITMYDRNML